MTLAKHKPTRSSAYCAWLRTLPCAWSGAAPPSEVSHFGRHGHATKADDYGAVPMSRRVHAHWHGLRFAGRAPLPRNERWPEAAAWTSEDVREWAAGYARGLRFRRAEGW